MSKIYKYKGYSFYQTDTIHANSGRPLYEIRGLKERGKRPFLTTVEGCKEYIREKTKPIVIYVDDPFEGQSNIVNPVKVHGKWYHFGLPSGWVYVLFENGEEMNVANRDGFDERIAESYAKHWSGYKDFGDVVAVIYKDSRDNEITRYRVRG